MVNSMVNRSVDDQFELYSVIYKNFSDTGFMVSRMPNPDRITISQGLSGFSGDACVTTEWNSSPLYYTGANYILMRFVSKEDFVAYMLKITSVNRSADELLEITFDQIDMDLKALKAVVNYKNRTSYANIQKELNMSITSHEDHIFGCVDKTHAQHVFDCANKNRTLPLMIDKIFYNEPHTVVKWKDGTTTVVGCAEGEEFSKELGLSVAIAEKYFELLGFPYPRAALKRFSEKGHDQTAKTKARREFKKNKKRVD